MNRRSRQSAFSALATAALLLFPLAAAIGIVDRSIEASPALGDVLAGPFVPSGAPCALGNGRGIAFDGNSLYYTIVDNRNIYRIDTAGNCLGVIGLPAGDPRISAGGPLAWDGSHLWTVDYSGALVMYRVDPATGATVASCSVAAANPGHPALAGLTYPDGLQWTGIPGSELVLSGELSSFGRPTAVAFMNTSCVIASHFTSPDPLDGQWSGVAYDGLHLWNVNPEARIVEQTDLAGVLSGVSFATADLQLEDLEFDPVTFAPLCAVWGNEAAATANRIVALEVPCLTISLDPAEETNEAGTSHTVTATIASGDDPVSGELVTFSVISGPNVGVSGVCSANVNCTTDANGQVSWTYTGAFAVGTDVIEACFTDQAGEERCAEAMKHWVDTTAPTVACGEGVNPGGNTPRAPGTGGTAQNPDGFYELVATDQVDTGVEISVVDKGADGVLGTADDTTFGPFPTGTTIKYVEANGAAPGINPGAGDVHWMIQGNGDFAIVAVDDAGNVTELQCHVPPPPR